MSLSTLTKKPASNSVLVQLRLWLPIVVSVKCHVSGGRSPAATGGLWIRNLIRYWNSGMLMPQTYSQWSARAPSAFSVLGIPGYHLSREPSASAAPARQGSMLNRNIFDLSLPAIKFCALIQNVKKFFMASCTLRIMQPPPTTASFSPDRHLNELPPNNLHPTSVAATVPMWCSTFPSTWSRVQSLSSCFQPPFSQIEMETVRSVKVRDFYSVLALLKDFEVLTNLLIDSCWRFNGGHWLLSRTEGRGCYMLARKARFFCLKQS